MHKQAVNRWLRFALIKQLIGGFCWVFLKHSLLYITNDWRNKWKGLECEDHLALIHKLVNLFKIQATGLFQDKRYPLGELQTLFLYNAVQYSYEKHYVLDRYLCIDNKKHGRIKLIITFKIIYPYTRAIEVQEL